MEVFLKLNLFEEYLMRKKYQTAMEYLKKNKNLKPSEFLTATNKNQENFLHLIARNNPTDTKFYDTVTECLSDMRSTFPKEFKELLEQNDSANVTPILAAAKAGNLNMVKILAKEYCVDFNLTAGSKGIVARKIYAFVCQQTTDEFNEIKQMMKKSFIFHQESVRNFNLSEEKNKREEWKTRSLKIEKLKEQESDENIGDRSGSSPKISSIEDIKKLSLDKEDNTNILQSKN